MELELVDGPLAEYLEGINNNNTQTSSAHEQRLTSCAQVMVMKTTATPGQTIPPHYHLEYHHHAFSLLLRKVCQH